MTPGPADNAPTVELTARSAPEHGLLESLSTAVLGLRGEDSCTEQMTGYRGAFADTAKVQPLDLGGGLWALLRISADEASRVLCVYNLADHPVSFSPTGVLPARRGIHFLHGKVVTGGSGTTVSTCRMEAHSFVWLGQTVRSGPCFEAAYLQEGVGIW